VNWLRRLFQRRGAAPAAAGRLRVGRRYLVRDFNKDSYFLCFMGKTLDGAYCFYNEAGENYRELTFTTGEKPVTEAGLFEKGYIREIPEGY